MEFSIGLLTRNEVSTLPRLLKSLSPFLAQGGEVVCLDGSSDDTPETARSLGCRVVKEPKRLAIRVSQALSRTLNQRFILPGEQPIPGQRIFDLAQARNHLMSLCRNDMVFEPDADEVLSVMDLEAISQGIRQGSELFTYTFVHSHDPQGRPEIAFNHSKFADRRKFHWHTECPVHEVLEGAGRIQWLPPDRLCLEHWQNPAPPTTSAALGLMWSAERFPANPRLSHYLARELMYQGRLRSAIREFERHIGMNSWVQERAQSMIYMAWCFGQLAEPGLQEQWLLEAFRIDPSRREAPMRLADFYFARGDHQRVACWAAAALEIPWTGNYLADRADYSHRPHDYLYWAKWQLGDHSGSRVHWEKCLEARPEDPRHEADARFYLDYTTPGISGWMDPVELDWLFHQAKEMSSIVEVGSWKGRSTHALLSGCPGKVVSVDHFLGSRGFDFEEKVHAAAVQNDSVWKEFQHNLRGFSNLEVRRMSSLEASAGFPDRSVDMVFLDGGHTEEELTQDIQAWLPKTKKLICGHDYSTAWPTVQRAVNQTLGPVGICHTIWFRWLSP